MATSLTLLLRKDQFLWQPKAQRAFEVLKQCTTEALVLTTPDFSLPGAVLLQNSHPITSFSKYFCPRLQRLSTYACELHAITTIVRKWRHYLLGHPFVILMNHRSLKYLMSQVIQTLKQQIYLTKLLGYDYTIQYKSDSTNIIADTLSWIPSSQLYSLSLLNFAFMDQFGLLYWNICHTRIYSRKSNNTPKHIRTSQYIIILFSLMARFGSRQPVSSLQFCWTNFIKNPLVATWELLKLSISFRIDSSRMICIRTFATMFLGVLATSKPSTDGTLICGSNF